MRMPGGVTCIVCGTLLLTLPLWGCGGGGSDGMKTGAGAEGEPTPEGGDGSPEPGGDGTDDDIDTGGPGDTGVTEPTDGDTSAAQLSIVGEYRRVPAGDAAGTVTVEFRQWGLWGGIAREDAAACTAIGCLPPGDTIFLASLAHAVDGSVSAAVNGIPSGTSPQAGSAVWSGEVLGYASEEIAGADGTAVTAYEAVWGAARLEADFETDTVDVEFSLLGEGRPDLSWEGLAVEAGAFGDGDGSIEGSFYGTDHAGAAGIFARGGLAGVFGMLRTSSADPDTTGPDEPSWPVEPGEPGTGATDGVSIAWGPRLGSSGLSALSGGNDEFGPEAADGLAAAAHAAPAAAANGVSQSSLAGQAVDGMRVHVVRGDEGNPVYELTDGGQVAVRIPSPLPHPGFSVALLTDLIPGIEPDLSSYPHDLLGMWAWNGSVGAFWGRSPELPGVASSGISPSGTATYEGDAAGLHAAGRVCDEVPGGRGDGRGLRPAHGGRRGRRVPFLRGHVSRRSDGDAGRDRLRAAGRRREGVHRHGRRDRVGRHRGQRRVGCALVGRRGLDDGRDVRLRCGRRERRGAGRVQRMLVRVGGRREPGRAGDRSVRRLRAARSSGANVPEPGRRIRPVDRRACARGELRRAIASARPGHADRIDDAPSGPIVAARQERDGHAALPRVHWGRRREA